MSSQNPAQQFPFEHLGSQIARNDYNFQSILNGLIEWDSTDNSTVTIRLMTDTDPYYFDYAIPSKVTVQNAQTGVGSVQLDSVVADSLYASIPSFNFAGDIVDFSIIINNSSGSSTSWKLFYEPVSEDAGTLATDGVYQIEIAEFESPNVFTLEKTISGYRLEYAAKRYFIRPNTNDADGVDITVAVRTQENIPDTPYNRSVGVFDTVNYVQYPTNENSKWTDTVEYVTDEGRSISEIQDYTAKMVFDHTDPNAKTVNFLNYEGPDLDQGLAVYLPIRSGGIKPVDGYTFEFNLRIWPDPSYTNALTVDHIINKAQIYFYSINDLDCISSPGNPIARFSMARMTNFYIWAENIAIPDKPVSYYVSFIYSKELDSWLLLDMNQLNDHVFVGPVGFVDPLGHTFNELGSNGDYIGYETCAFPTYTDPFSNIDLTRYSENPDRNTGDSTFHRRLT